MSKGDHIYVVCRTHKHHAIDLGNGNVIEYSRRHGVRLRSKKDFSHNKTIHVQKYGKCLSVEQTIVKAYSRLGEKNYCLFSNNCEHFAYWCKMGVHKSEQVDNAFNYVSQVVRATPKLSLSVSSGLNNFRRRRKI